MRYENAVSTYSSNFDYLCQSESAFTMLGQAIAIFDRINGHLLSGLDFDRSAIIGSISRGIWLLLNEPRLYRRLLCGNLNRQRRIVLAAKQPADAGFVDPDNQSANLRLME
jgi:hypothetical protein